MCESKSMKPAKPMKEHGEERSMRCVSTPAFPLSLSLKSRKVGEHGLHAQHVHPQCRCISMSIPTVHAKPAQQSQDLSQYITSKSQNVSQSSDSHGDFRRFSTHQKKCIGIHERRFVDVVAG
jgi:hypothetical protein